MMQAQKGISMNGFSSQGPSTLLGGFSASNKKLHMKADSLFKAPVIRLDAKEICLDGRIEAIHALIIETDKLLINGAQIPSPEKFSIHAKQVEIMNSNDTTQWIQNLIQEVNGKKTINCDNFPSEVQEVETSSVNQGEKTSIVEKLFLEIFENNSFQDCEMELVYSTGNSSGNKTSLRIVYNPEGLSLSFPFYKEGSPITDHVMVFSEDFMVLHNIKSDISRIVHDRLGKDSTCLCESVSLNSFSASSLFAPCIVLNEISSVDEANLIPHFECLFKSDTLTKQYFQIEIQGEKYQFAVVFNPEEHPLVANYCIPKQMNRAGPSTFFASNKNYESSWMTKAHLLYTTDKEIPDLLTYNKFEQILLKAYYEAYPKPEDPEPTNQGGFFDSFIEMFTGKKSPQPAKVPHKEVLGGNRLITQYKTTQNEIKDGRDYVYTYSIPIFNLFKRLHPKEEENKESLAS